MPQCTDDRCPCQDRDGSACHYVATGDTKAWPLPPGVQLIRCAIEDKGGPRCTTECVSCAAWRVAGGT